MQPQNTGMRCRLPRLSLVQFSGVGKFAAGLGLVWAQFAMAQTTDLPELGEVEVRASPLKATIPGDSTGSKARINGSDLSPATANTLPEASFRVPGFFAYGSTARNTGFNIRGAGNSQFNDGMDSGTGLYIDGIYLARQSYGALSLYDLEDFSVLRGPQGANYGLGSTTGEVHLRTRLPSFTPSTEMSGSIGNFGYKQFSLTTTGPLGGQANNQSAGQSSTMAGRLSVYGQVRDGLLTNQFDGSKLNDQDRLALRGQVLWAPVDELLVRVIGELGLNDQKCCAVALLAPVSASIKASDDYMGYKRPGTNPYDRVTDNDRTTRGRLIRNSLSVIAEWTPPGRHTLTSLTGLNGLNISPTQFDDGTSMRLLNSNITSKSSQITQELRLNSRFLRAETTVGMFYIHQRLQGRERAVLGDEIARWALGGALRSNVPGLTQQNSGFLIDAVLPPQALNGLTLNTPYSQVSNGFSTFASSDLKLSPSTTLTTGLRWTTSNRRAEISRDRSGGNLNSSPLSLTNNLAVLKGLLGQNVQDLTYDGIIDSLVGPSFERRDSRSDQGATGKLALRHQLTDQASVYASAATGFKSGGVNLAGITRQVKPQFDPERATNFELGFNKTHPSGRLSYNLSLYNTRIKNYQALTHDEGEGLVPNPRPNNVINIPKVRLRGVEFDLSGRLTPNLNLLTGLAYNQAISTSFPNAPDEDTGQNNKDLSGKQLYNAPRWSGFVGLEQRIPHQNKDYSYWGLDYQFRSGTFGAVDQSRSSFIEGYQITNLRLGYRNQQQGWGVQAWVRNLFDEDYLLAITTVYGVGEYGGYAGDPRTYGITVDVQLGK